MTLAGFALGGGIAAAATMNTSTTASSSTSSPADVSALLSASSNSRVTTTTPGLGHLRRAGGMYGTITYLGKDGRDHTLAFERGTIVTATATAVVVRAQDGTTMTWLLESTTVVRQHGTKTTTAALQPGQLAFVGGPVTNGARDARLIAIRGPKPVPAENGSKA